MKISPEDIKGRMIALIPHSYQKLTDGPLFNALLTAMCQVMTETLEAVMAPVITVRSDVSPDKLDRIKAFLDSSGRSVTRSIFLDSETENREPNDSQIELTGTSGYWSFGDPIDLTAMHVKADGWTNAPAGSVTATEPERERFKFRWKCLNQQCPERPPTLQDEPPTCYTCGDRMEMIK